MRVASARVVAPGAVHLPHHLSVNEQCQVAEQCLDIGSRQAGFYTPIVRGGHPMSVRMLCLGRHWNAREYRYEPTRSDVDGRPVPQLPAELSDVAAAIGRDAGFEVAPDICIVNWYGAASRMGLHQ